EGKPHSRPAAPEVDPAIGQLFHQNTGRRGDAAPRLHSPQRFVKMTLQAGDACHRGMGQLREQAPRLRQPAAASIWLDQRRAELAFQGVHLFPDRRMSKVQGARRGCETAQTSRFAETPQLLQRDLLVGPALSWRRGHEATCRWSLRFIKNLLIPLYGSSSRRVHGRLRVGGGEPGSPPPTTSPSQPPHPPYHPRNGRLFPLSPQRRVSVMPRFRLSFRFWTERAFTLIELLVVIAIIAVLIGLL